MRMGEKRPFVSIIILNYNSGEHLPHLLPSLHNLDYPADQYEILLVDNASTDDSVAWTKSHYPTVRIVENGANLGFAAGNMAGVRVAKGEWVAILNPDTRVAPDWLTELTRPIMTDHTVDCVASRMLNWEGTAVDFADAAINFMGWGCQPGFGEPPRPQANAKPLLFACGGAMLIKRDIFLKTGGFDPDYFAYFEDVDLGWRLWLMGYKVVYAPKATVYHRHHGTWDKVNDAKRWVLAERNTLATIIKNYDNASLAYTLSAAVLLMAQRAYRDVNPAPHLFGVPTAPETAVYTPTYYLKQIWQLLRQGNFSELYQRIHAEIQRRQRRQTPTHTTAQTTYSTPHNGHLTAPPIAISRLIAATHLHNAWPTLLEKRKTIQAYRRRSDKEIFPLFQWALISNFADPAIIHATNHVVHKFHLSRLFDATQPLPAVSPAEYRRSLSVSRMLLQLMGRVTAEAQISAAAFALDGPTPQPVYQLPVTAVAILAEINRWLWELPDLPLPALLIWLEDRINTYHD
ncbi:MAG: glycosyltransferase family 2 protein [Chloroflexi bacterium]|nr:MAG: glycosyltransferase family 2 protein [Chloroflexota bacterium]